MLPHRPCRLLLLIHIWRLWPGPIKSCHQQKDLATEFLFHKGKNICGASFSSTETQTTLFGLPCFYLMWNFERTARNFQKHARININRNKTIAWEQDSWIPRFRLQCLRWTYCCHHYDKHRSLSTLKYRLILNNFWTKQFASFHTGKQSVGRFCRPPWCPNPSPIPYYITDLFGWRRPQ